MPIDTYNPDQAAALIGASASTIRNWCKVYASELSEGANPPIGTERRLTQQDVAKLQQIKVWRDNRTPVQEIIRLLQAAASANEPAQLTIDAIATPTQPQAHQTPQDASDGALAIITAHNTLQSRVDDLARHIERVEAAARAQAQEARASQQERINMLVTGIVIGAVVVLIIVAVVLGMTAR